MSTEKHNEQKPNSNESTSTSKRAISTKPMNTSTTITHGVREGPQSGSYVDLGKVSFRQLVDVFANPPAETTGFDICPEDEERFRKFLKGESP